MNTRLEISRGPHGLRLYLPSGRTLDVSATAAGATCIEQILRDADTYEERFQKQGYIKEFPTQAILDAWESRAEIERQVERIKAEKAAAQREATREEWAEKGIDIDAMEFKL